MTMERQLGPDPRLEPHAKAHDYRVKITRTWTLTVTASDDERSIEHAQETIDKYHTAPDEDQGEVVDDLGETEKHQD